MKTKFLFLLMLVIPAYSQTNVSFYAGVNPPTNILAKNNSDFLDMFWNSGRTVGMSGERFISRLVAISSSVEYGYYGFNGYAPGTMIPEVHMKSAIGEASKVWRIFVEAKLFSSDSKVVPFYVSTGVGYVLEQIGVINATYEDMNGPTFIQTVVQYQSKDFLVHTLGLGIRWNLFSRVGLDLKGQYFTNYDDRMHTTLRAGFVYSVGE